MYKYADRFTINKLKYNLVGVFRKVCILELKHLGSLCIFFCLVGQTCMVKGNNQLNERTVNYHDRIFLNVKNG